MGPEFFQTGMGKKFFEGDLPRLVKALERIAAAVEKKDEPHTVGPAKTREEAKAEGVPETQLERIYGKVPVGRISVAGGKYTFFVPEGDYRVHVHRHGEEWLRIEEGHKAILALMAELEEERAKP